MWPFKHDCSRHGHKFQPRYSEKDSALSQSRHAKFKYFDLEEVRNLMVLREYVCDVCVHCGLTTKKQEI